MGRFVVTLVYAFSRATGDLDPLEIAPAAAGRSMLRLGMQSGPLHKKYKVYLDRVGVAKVPETTMIDSPRYFRKSSNIFGTRSIRSGVVKAGRNIQRDRDDVKHLAKVVPLDLEALKERHRKQLRWQFGNAERGSYATSLD